MVNCPIIHKEIEEDECEASVYNVNTGEKDDQVLRKIKRTIGWKFICRNCKHFKPVQ